MKNSSSKAILTIVSMLIASAAWAQGAHGSSGSGNILLYALISVAVLVFFYIVVQVSDSLLVIESRQNSSTANSNANFSLFPSWKEIFAPRLPDFLKNKPITILKRGHDILLEGEAARVVDKSVAANTYAVQPPNFVGISPIPKMMVEVGTEVKAGDPLFHDKTRPELMWVAPVSGEVVAINRGEKRAITSVAILADKEMKYRSLPSFKLEDSTREALVSFLLDAGAWPLICQRPFGVMADIGEAPRDIFISTFDTAPLAPDLNFVVEGKEEAFQKGLDVLNKLTAGKVHLGLDGRGKQEPHKAFTEARGVELHYFHGKHPIGNVGVQIHHIQPIAAGDKVWSLGVQEVIALGRLFTEGRYNAERVVAVAGAELKEPKYVNTYLGAKMGNLVEGNLANGHVRLISGDVLSGEAKTAEDFLNYHDDQVTVVREGDEFTVFGWLLPSLNTPSISKTFPSAFMPKMKFRAETNTHGEKRAFVVTGSYEKVLPMDIHPQELFKSILIGDFEKMEGLGIYELLEEDVALCEFVCVSKQPIQHILRQGLDMMREQS
ncbi:MAG: Na(+)-translocating NADH-quinone reductase subunit A [Phaeodactylibacter sp.]|nr:Na(+)-translocating NADH-quinone reductase subunit A [Phaeodactylibacter sp.]MCB9276391.1 Na(+)-translocating NADH-quinone reductase subunit A [Lewinellaceae bacterium]